MKNLIIKIFFAFLLIIVLFFMIDFNIQSMPRKLELIFGVLLIIITASFIISFIFFKIKKYNMPLYIEVNQFEIFVLGFVVFILGLVLLFKH